MRRVIWWSMFIHLIFSLPVFAQEIPEIPEVEEVFIGERIDVGCFNIWLHADGKTWQNTDGKPGPEEPYEGEDLDNDPQKEKYLRYVTFQVEPNQEWTKNYENIRVEASVDWFNTFTEEDYIAAGGGGKASKDGLSYIYLDNYSKFKALVLSRKPYDYQLAPEVSNLTVKFYLHPKKAAEDVKQDHQADLVEGWRWYLPIHLKFYGTPKTPVIDIETVEIQQTSPVQTGTKQTATAVFRNNGDNTEQFTAQYYAAGKQIGSELLTLEAGESCERKFSWQVPNDPGTYSLKIEAVPLPGENNATNNSKTVFVTAEGVNLIDPICEFTNIDTHTWETTYNWKVYRDCSYFDENGVWHKKTCSSTKRETVTYQEKLTVDFSIDTKQGDPNGGRESRGYWEIYPDTQNLQPLYNPNRNINIYGEDPNKVTRSGYGFDLTVITTYWTDWEKKVPSKADPKGGELTGPTQVAVQFHDCHIVKELVAVDTEVKENSEGKTIITTWKLPETRYTFADGETIYERKHYTDVSLPDGRYLLRAIVSPCGLAIPEICGYLWQYV